ncbi:helix-turn-helix domain-containing protein [Calothrix rhizosoleniae]|uniref:helix-turn-helix domain-containing protein n=1 Tax=Calothrix rhizosoleniae TaxID=888997 RepID=UPI000B49C76B|nr:helix-turn-helix domain-containing protein [Calothrix rhizosoleniae]
MVKHNLPVEPLKDTESIKRLECLLEQEPSQGKLVAANGQQIPIPEPVYQVLREVVHAMALGKAISIVPQNREMTTQEAADFLNVSRPYLIKLLKQGEIDYIKVGSHRRVNFQDVMEYKEQRNLKRREGMKEMTQFLQEEGFYDEDSCELDE